MAFVYADIKIRYVMFIRACQTICLFQLLIYMVKDNKVYIKMYIANFGRRNDNDLVWDCLNIKNY